MNEWLDPDELLACTKGQIVAAISQVIGLEPPKMSTGSTEPGSLFIAVNRQLSLGLDPNLDKPGMAKGIVEASGARWLPTYESRGATITKRGLIAVYESVRYFLG